MATLNWTPSPNDATSLAAIRWFACTLEAVAIELYATDRTTYEHIEKVMRAAMKELAMANVKPLMSSDDCPDGYVLCNGLCKPACDGLEEASAMQEASVAKRSAGRKSAARATKRAGGRRR